MRSDVKLPCVCCGRRNLYGVPHLLLTYFFKLSQICILQVLNTSLLEHHILYEGNISDIKKNRNVFLVTHLLKLSDLYMKAIIILKKLSIIQNILTLFIQF